MTAHTHSSAASAPALTLNDYLAPLPILDRRVVSDCCARGRTIPEVAVALGISPRHAARILVRALEFMRALAALPGDEPRPGAANLEADARAYLGSSQSAAA